MAGATRFTNKSRRTSMKHSLPLAALALFIHVIANGGNLAPEAIMLRRADRDAPLLLGGGGDGDAAGADETHADADAAFAPLHEEELPPYGSGAFGEPAFLDVPRLTFTPAVYELGSA